MSTVPDQHGHPLSHLLQAGLVRPADNHTHSLTVLASVRFVSTRTPDVQGQDLDNSAA